MDFIDRLRIPIWLESRAPIEQAALVRDLRTHDLDRHEGGGRPVMLIPGFLAGDVSLARMARWLRDLGYRPCKAGMRANVDCTERALTRLEGQVEGFAEKHGCRVSLVGQSRGGSMARVLAVRRPDLIDLIISLGSPLTDQFAVHPLVSTQARALAALGSLGVPGLFSYACRGDCCVQAHQDLLARFPSQVGFVSVYSKSDGIIDWRTCLDPAAQLVEVQSSHVGMAANREVYRAIASALPARGEDRPLAAAA